MLAEQRTGLDPVRQRSKCLDDSEREALQAPRSSPEGHARKTLSRAWGADDGPSARESVYQLRARTRWLSPCPRERDCGRMCVEHTDSHPSIVVKREGGIPRASFRGILTCGHIWSCPVCSQNLRAKRAEGIVAAVAHLGGWWRMLTVTLRHRQGMDLKRLIEGLTKAWRRTRQGGRIQRIWSENVKASVRSLEVTYGENGWHPHVHILIRSEEWDEDERDALQARWAEAVRRELGAQCMPDDIHGLVWSNPFDASRAGSGRQVTYLAKLGLETAGIAKEGRGNSRTPWDIARAAADGDSRALWLWREYIAATKGRRMIEMDDRAAAAAKAAAEAKLEECDEFGRDHVDGEGAPEPPQTHTIYRDDVRALRAMEPRIPTIFAIVLRAAEERGQEGVREWVEYARKNAFRPRFARSGESPEATGPPFMA